MRDPGTVNVKENLQSETIYKKILLDKTVNSLRQISDRVHISTHHRNHQTVLNIIF